MMSKSFIYALLLFLFASVVKFYFVRLSHNAGSYTTELAYNNGDASHYLEIGRNINEHFVYSDNDSDVPTESSLWRPPVWPFVLSVFFFVTKSPLGLILLKILFESLLFIGGYLMFRKVGKGRKMFHPLFLLLLIEPHYLKYSITFLSESLTSVLLLLLSVYLMYLFINNKRSVLFSIAGAVTILCHPVCVFFVLSLLFLYWIRDIRSYKKETAISVLVFTLIMLAWPVRNNMVFGKGMHMTASEGATFSKGWNEKVIELFNNVDGDLADENINLKYAKDYTNEDISVLDLSKTLKQGTWNYIKQASLMDLVNIPLVKLRSNFNPIPEKTKGGTLEALGMLFRFLFLLCFIQALYILFKNRKNIFSNENIVPLIVLSVIIGQVLMATYIYTGIRFNSIYGMVLTFSFFYMNRQVLDQVKIRLLKTT